MREYDAAVHRADTICQKNMTAYLEDTGVILDTARDKAKAAALRGALVACEEVVSNLNDEVIEPRLENFYSPFKKGAKNGREWDTDSTYELNVFSYFPAKDEPALKEMGWLAEQYREAAITVSGALEKSYRQLVVESATLPLTFKEYATLGDNWFVNRAQVAEKIRGQEPLEKRTDEVVELQSAMEKVKRREYVLETFPGLRGYVVDIAP
jgi:hypothetical protein